MHAKKLIKKGSGSFTSLHPSTKLASGEEKFKTLRKLGEGFYTE